jgi:hypothetical protein
MELGCLENIAPVFVVGAGRSGTTALQLALNCHPQLAVFGETAAFSRYHKYGSLSRPSQLARFLRDWRPSLAIWSRYEGFVDDPIIQQSLRRSKTYAEAVNVMLGTFARREQKPVWGEKTPAHVFWLKQIRHCFPGARFVHIIRDPRAVVSSGMKLATDSLPSQWNIYAHVQYWLRCMEIHRQEESAGKPTYLSIRYEDLVADGEKTLRAVCAFLGVEFVPAMLNFSERSKEYSPKDTQGKILGHQLMTQKPLQASRSKAWLEELDPRSVALVEHMTSKQMAGLGYKAETDRRLVPGPLRLFYFAVRWRLSEIRRASREALQEIFWRLRAALEP